MASSGSGGSAFDRSKAERLRDLRNAAERDKSPKGFVDRQIVHIVELINAHPDYVTASSCSGRISLFETEAPRENPKLGRWLVISHDPLPGANPGAQLLEALAQNPPVRPQESEAWLKMEPFIMCVECRDLASAAELVQLALSAGYRESGLVVAHNSGSGNGSGNNGAAEADNSSSGASARFTVTIRTSLRVEMPLRLGEHLLVPDVQTGGLDRLLEIANKKMELNAARYQRLFEVFRAAWLASGKISAAAAAAAVSNSDAAILEEESKDNGVDENAAADAEIRGSLDEVLLGCYTPEQRGDPEFRQNLAEAGVTAVLVLRAVCQLVKAKLDSEGTFDRRFGVWKPEGMDESRCGALMAVGVLPAAAKQLLALGGDRLAEQVGANSPPQLGKKKQKKRKPAPEADAAAAKASAEKNPAAEEAVAAPVAEPQAPTAVASVALVLPPKFRSRVLAPTAPSTPPATAPQTGSPAAGPNGSSAESQALSPTASQPQLLSQNTSAAVGAGGGTPFSQIRRGLTALLQDLPGGIDYGDGRSLGETVAALMETAPKHYKILGQACLLPEAAFTGPLWERLFEGRWELLWRLVAGVLGVNKLARAARIAPDLVRSSQVQLIWSAAGLDSEDPATAGWVTHRENGVVYRFDITRCMFSQGNVAEKARMGRLAQPHETVVDLYAGIGYFSLPFLVHGRVAFLHACEINPDAVEALRAGLVANRIPPSRYSVHPGDNRRPELKRRLADVAHRVSLGYLPLSEDGFDTALHCLRPEGGWLHVHANVAVGGERDYLEQTVLPRLRALLQAGLAPDAEVPLNPAKAKLGFRCTHTSLVKSYAPRVRHLVYDILCAADAESEAPAQQQQPQPQQQQQQQAGGAAAVPPAPEAALWQPWQPAGCQPGTVPVLTNVSSEQFWREIVAQQRPVVIRGVDLGRAAEAWSWEYLAGHRGGAMRNREVQVHETSSCRLDFLLRNYRLGRLPWAEFLSRVADSAGYDLGSEREGQLRYYLRSLPPGGAGAEEVANFWRDYPSLSGDFVAPPWFAGAPVQQESKDGQDAEEAQPQQQQPQQQDQASLFSSVLRLSSGGIQLWTHNDMVDNVLCHLRGRKRVILYPPEQAHNLYVPLQPHASTSPVVDVDTPDLVQYPRYAEAARSALVLTLEPGDCLFLPALWYHNVLTLEPSVSISLFWRPLAGHLYPDRDVYGNKDLVPAAEAIQLGQQVQAALAGVPEYYRRFYAERIVREFDL